jgi:cyclic peptide transporter
MRPEKGMRRLTAVMIIAMLALTGLWAGVASRSAFVPEEFDRQVREFMDDGDIPGLSVAVVTATGQVYTRGYGVQGDGADTAVTDQTLFELASCSKAFTAFAALRLADLGKIDIDAPVSNYLEGFHLLYEGEKIVPTVRQFLRHTTGVPAKTVDLIKPGEGEGELRATAMKISGYSVDHKPGTHFEYATINYDLVGAIIEVVTGKTFEAAMKELVFTPLEMTGTEVGVGDFPLPVAEGHKISFFAPRHFDAPVYRGNNPAGYVQSNAVDMARWLQLNLGVIDNPYKEIFELSHQRDDTISPNKQTLASYGYGWQTYVDATGLVEHDGLNPNFTSYMAFNKKENVAVAVMASSNSAYTTAIGRMVMDMAMGKAAEDITVPPNEIDKGGSVITVLLVIFLLAVIAFWISIVRDIVKGKRSFLLPDLKTLGKMAGTLILICPFLYGIYLLPFAMTGMSWETTLVWAPFSFQAAVFMLLVSIGAGAAGFLFSTLFPQHNQMIHRLPLIVVLSLLAGGANAVVIFLITTSINNNIQLIYQLFYFALAFGIYIFGRKIIQTDLLKITFRIVYDMRVNLVRKVFLTHYQKFEQLDRGRVFATLSDDTGQIGNAANLVVAVITSLVTIVCAFVYLATIAFWATAVTVLVVIAISLLYNSVMAKARVLLEQARDTQNEFMGLINNMIDGFKELSMQVNKKREYSADVDEVCRRFRTKTTKSGVKFVNAFLIGESLLLVVLAAVGFGIPQMFPEISKFTLMSFIMILLFLIGPFNVILNSIPNIIRIRVAWGRVKGFERDIPATLDPKVLENRHQRDSEVASLQAREVMFEYTNENDDEKFGVGPIDLTFNKGEVTFIIGGNGSGKTTLAKLLTGLYNPQKGSVEVEGSSNGSSRLGENFSAVFSDFHLFQKMYNVDLDEKDGKVDEYLELLRMKGKVTVEDNEFSTIELSGGQRKRLALLQCYLEDSPIYLFDEIAADQDPEFRKFFYRELLPRMKDDGKIVIVITHDDHYFDVADRIIKMDMGKIDTVNKEYKVTT